MNEPLNNNELYGLDADATVAQPCPLQEDGLCPNGCNACEVFAREMEMTPASPGTKQCNQG
jgi:hypothetical protein